jgi:hypothetical protein
MGELVTVIHPKTGKRIRILREFAEGDGIWIAEGFPYNEEDLQWIKAFVHGRPTRGIIPPVQILEDLTAEQLAELESSKLDENEKPDAAQT